MQSDLISYQSTICRIESIVYFDTAAAAVHHLKAEKVRCEEREYVPQHAHRLATYAHCLSPNMHTAWPPTPLSPPAAAVAAVAAVAALVSLPLLLALRVDSILGAGTVMVVGGGTQWLLCDE
jgi:hypothetical protein